jgi:hypothetical protein
MGCPTAKIGPCINLDDISSHLLLKFERGKVSKEAWEDFIMEASLKYVILRSPIPNCTW